MKEQEIINEKEKKKPKIYCHFSNNENGIEYVLGLAFRDYAENKLKQKV